jgi:hypothetical protein
MTTQSIDGLKADSVPSKVARRLLVVWRNPVTRTFATVAQLNQLDDGRFVFNYMDNAQVEDGFFPLDEYPDIKTTYLSDSLPVFFANRVMSSGRGSYAEYLDRLGIASFASSEIPMEVLVRTGAGRATDTFHVVEAPVNEADRFESRFFVSGIAHIDGAVEIVRSLRSGASLALRAEPGNEANSRAVLLDADEGRPIGWVPDWLCDQVRTLMDDGFELRASVEQVNETAPLRLQVLCRIDAIKVRPASETA